MYFPMRIPQMLNLKGCKSSFLNYFNEFLSLAIGFAKLNVCQYPVKKGVKMVLCKHGNTIFISQTHPTTSEYTRKILVLFYRALFCFVLLTPNNSNIRMSDCEFLKHFIQTLCMLHAILSLLPFRLLVIYRFN